MCPPRSSNRYYLLGRPWQDLLPYSQGPGSYVNPVTDYDADRVRASYGPAKYQRLAQIKAAYDPGNVCHRNPNISPAG